MLQVTPISAFQDNYIWCLHRENDHCCVIIDPGEAAPVIQFLQQYKKQPVAILLTHHHADHTGGLADLLSLWPDIRIIGAEADAARIPLLTEKVRDCDMLIIPEWQLQFDVLAVPGHTLGHLAFYAAPLLFCGDTLFSAGCGRIFEGTAAMMYHSLTRLAKLPDDTQIYCAHEYTLANLQFAISIEPDNLALIEYQQQCQHLRNLRQATLPVTLEKEKQINPFLRCENSILQQKHNKTSALELFTVLRAMKDIFKG